MAPPIGAGPFFKEKEMFDITLTWTPFKIRQSELTRDIKLGAIRLFKDAIGEFVKKIVHDQLIPVDTGMSAASLHDAAVEAKIWGDIQSNISMRRKNTQRKGFTSMGGYYDKSRYRNMKEGIAAASRATKIVLTYPKLEFNFSINVFQWYLWEIMRNQWNSLEPASQAFMDYINNNFNEYMPNIGDYI
jgi:hypothetical protein